MSDPDPTEGGLRDRMIFLSFTTMLRHCLTQLPWLGGTLGAGIQPVEFRTSALAKDTKIVPNLVVATSGPIDPMFDIETGSGMSEDHTEVWVTIYAQNESVGRHLSGDIYAICRGKLASIGAEDAGFPVYDWTTTAVEDRSWPPAGDPTPLFFVDLEDIHLDRAMDPKTGDETLTWAVAAAIVDER